MENPCTYCVPPKRNATCHSTCKDYKKFSFLNHIERDFDYKEKDIDYFLSQCEGERIDRINKGYSPLALKHKTHN